MNQNYRIVYNDSLDVWQCVPELAKTKGKAASGNKIVQLGVLATAMASGSTAIAVDLDNGGYLTNQSYNETINIASTLGSSSLMTVHGDHNTLNMTATGNGQYWIGVGHRGNGYLNIEQGATATSSDSVIVGVMDNAGRGVLKVATDGKLNVANYLIIGDGGNGRLDIASASTVTAKDVSLGNEANAEGHIIVSDANAKLTATNSMTIGDEGKGILEINHGGTVETGVLILGKNSGSIGDLDMSTVVDRSVLKTGNIERGAGEAYVSINHSNIVATRDESNFFANFNDNTNVSGISITNGLEFNTNGHNVTINPNAVMHGNAGRTNIVTGGGFEKTGQGTLTISENTIRNVSGDIAVSEGTLQINGNHRFANGDTLYIGAHSPTDYGKFHVSGNLDVSQGKLSVYAADLVRTMLATPVHNLTFNDMVKAGNLTGQFTTVNVVDDSGTPLTTSLVPQYNGNAVNLTTNPSSPPPPTTASTQQRRIPKRSNKRA